MTTRLLTLKIPVLGDLYLPGRNGSAFFLPYPLTLIHHPPSSHIVSANLVARGKTNRAYSIPERKLIRADLGLLEEHELYELLYHAAYRHDDVDQSVKRSASEARYVMRTPNDWDAISFDHYLTVFFDAIINRSSRVATLQQLGLRAEVADIGPGEDENNDIRRDTSDGGLRSRLEKLASLVLRLSEFGDLEIILDQVAQG
ncbi:hypothetical protein N7532_002875 [Penicillium argentinense]|uniref:Uncharacterized protein n=1 Tax=Penicillium argentinense TaxID=1131581 RepID=A0A9W9G180_9EURO|nr:uncharacterized protein N7532_002875 [Penicillium argentinense]KAJ5110230.1 hypothetical protein N7532_002875 [Penicillium argentinense]